MDTWRYDEVRPIATGLARLAIEQPFEVFIYWREMQAVEQIERFAHEVVPLARQLVAMR